MRRRSFCFLDWAPRETAISLRVDVDAAYGERVPEEGRLLRLLEDTLHGVPADVEGAWVELGEDLADD